MGDAFHILHRIKVPKNHGMRIAFMHAFRDAILVEDPEIKRRVVMVLKQQGLTDR